MNCEEFAAVQTGLIEDCLEGDVRVHAEAHAAVCSRCGARLEAELTVKAAVAEQDHDGNHGRHGTARQPCKGVPSPPP